jgi:hypothetical protein
MTGTMKLKLKFNKKLVNRDSLYISRKNLQQTLGEKKV